MARVRWKTLACSILCFVFLGWAAFDLLYIAPKQALHAKEAVLKEDLYNMREAINQYTRDKHKHPQTLDDLVTAGYLHAIPKDPFTKRADTWQTGIEDLTSSNIQTPLGITDIQSGSGLTGSDGTAYSSW